MVADAATCVGVAADLNSITEGQKSLTNQSEMIIDRINAEPYQQFLGFFETFLRNFRQSFCNMLKLPIYKCEFIYRNNCSFFNNL